jgi:hypothetical protein
VVSGLNTTFLLYHVCSFSQSQVILVNGGVSEEYLGCFLTFIFRGLWDKIFI